MTGILEQIAADVAAIKAHLAGQAANVAATAPQTLAQQPQTIVQPQTVAQQPQTLGGAGAPLGGAPQFPTVSAEQITALITPHVGDPNLKAALQQQMAAMGIAALPDAQPHQYGELYARFQQVIGQFAAVAQQQVQPAAAPASII